VGERKFEQEKRMNLTLIKPSDEYIDEIRAFKQEFIDKREAIPGTYGEFVRLDISEWIKFCTLCENADTLPKFSNRLGFVEHEQYLLLRKNDKKILGIIMLRHNLDKQLSEFSGHIGFSIRPSERGNGYAKAMLSLCLDKCPALGFNRVLITCNTNNNASRKTILACGGSFDRIAIEFDGGIVERYWVPCGDFM
jgi:predicted acetyltransferase